MILYRLQFAESLPCSQSKPITFAIPAHTQLSPAEAQVDPKLACPAQVGTKLVALNLSQQTDSADLLGGFQPVDPSHALLPLLEHFQVCYSACTFAEHTAVNFPVHQRIIPVRLS